MTEAEYIALVDFTGRELHPDKRGAIKMDEPKALLRLGLDKSHWTMKVKGVGSSYWRVVGSLGLETKSRVQGPIATPGRFP